MIIGIYYFEKSLRTVNKLHLVCYLPLHCSYIKQSVCFQTSLSQVCLCDQLLTLVVYLNLPLHSLMFKFLFKEREAAKRMFSGKRGQDSASKGKKAKT